MPTPTDLTLEILPQPDDETCGPTCLHAVYGYYGDRAALQTVIDEVTRLHSGGTLAVYLGTHALRRGYDAVLYTYNLDVFDPTWFDGGEVDLLERLEARAAARPGGRLATAAHAYRDFLLAGGDVRYEELRPEIFRRNLQIGRPILTGLSSTYLYDSARERYTDGRLEYDDIGGDPTGHFVVIHGYDVATDSVLVADPLRENPSGVHNYRVGILRLLGAVMLGVLTYEGNLLVVTPAEPPA